MKFVSIIIGSKSDYSVMRESAETLEKFGVPYELIISSVIEVPERTKNYLRGEEKGAQVFIGVVGMGGPSCLGACGPLG